MNKVFSDLNQYFDHIYVLTLKGYEQRQASIAENLDGLNWTFFWGVDKRELPVDILQDPKYYDDVKHRATKRTSRGMTLAEVACAMSHLAIYQDMLDKGYERVLIFEDDVLPCLEELQNFLPVMAELPDDWDCVMLGYYDEKRPSLANKLQHTVYRLFRLLHIANWQHVSDDMMDMMLLKPHSPSFYTMGKAMGAHAYAISQRAARAYIDYQTPVIMQADRVFLFNQVLNKLKAYMLKRPMFTLSELSQISSIQGKQNR